jgi:hypothetical protein
MSIQTRKESIIQEVLKIKDSETISIFEKILKDRKIKEYEGNLKPMSLEKLKAEIDQSFEEIRNGKFISDEILEKEINKW